MKRLVLFALVGGGIGAGAALARNDPGSDETADLKTAAVSGAAAGGFVGLVLDRRARRKRKKQSALVNYSHKARPKVDAAVEAAFAAAEFALPKVEAAAQVARERAKEKAIAAGGVAKEKAIVAGDIAREKAAETAIHAKHVAAERADIAKHKAKKSGHPKAAKALDLLPV